MREQYLCRRGRNCATVSRKATYRASNVPVASISGWPFILIYTQWKPLGIRSQRNMPEIPVDPARPESLQDKAKLGSMAGVGSPLARPQGLSKFPLQGLICILRRNNAQFEKSNCGIVFGCGHGAVCHAAYRAAG